MTEKNNEQIKLHVAGKTEGPTTEGSDLTHADNTKSAGLVEQGDRLEDSEQIDTVENHEDELSRAVRSAEENRDKWIRAVAEFENYKKRSIQERSKLLKYKNEELIRDLLPVLDNLERAIAASTAQSSGSLLDGVKMTVTMFKDVLGRFGATPIESVGKTFNPEFHEAIATIKDPSRDPNTIVEEMEKGYMYQDRLLRPAKVVVSTR